MEEQEVQEIEEDAENTGIANFNPPVYIQRYLAVQLILSQDKWISISKVVEFGCAELKFIKYLRTIENITHVCAVDIDENAMLYNRYEVQPRPFDYIKGYNHNLTIELFKGSVAEADSRFLDADAVIGIELIEHLHSEELEKVPQTVFQYMKPKLVIFTTPNADFNVFFKLDGFRHYDHKFEWTRNEFENWCNGITEKFPDYDVCFEGIGKGPEGTEHLGCCSQMAIFSRKLNSCNTLLGGDEIGSPYKLLEKYEYPVYEDTRSSNQKFLDSLTYEIACTNNKFLNEYDDLKLEIPIDFLWVRLQNYCDTKDVLINMLMENGYVLKEKKEEIYLEVDYQESDDEESCASELENSVSRLVLTESAPEENWDI